MNIRLIIAMSVGLVIALWTGLAVGNGEYGKAGFVVTGIAFAVSMAVIGKRYRFEGWFIAIIVACYFLGGKGFSYQRVVAIIYVGEATLALLLVFHLVRVMTGATSLFPKHRLTAPLLIFLVYGFIHLLVDRREFPLIMVLRDTATVYYALFFFFVYGSMQHKPTRDYILKLLPIIAAISLLLYTVTVFGRLGVPVGHATMIRGAPLILQTVDAMIPVCIGFSAFAYIKALQGHGILRGIYLLSSIGCTAPLFYHGKAVFYVAFFAYLGLFLIVGHWKILLTIIPMGIVAVLFLMAMIDSGMIQDRDSRFQRSLDEFSSFNVFGVGSAKQKHAQRTVEWRMTWWTMVTEDVMEKRPFFGLGMGSDISSEFHAKFNNSTVVNVNRNRARYPHNIVFTVLGRMGLIGLVIFIPIVILIMKELWIGLQTLRRRGSQCDPRYAFTWAFVLAGFVNAFFQSTFEAPYTAVMFWTLLAVLAVMNETNSQETEGTTSGTGSDGGRGEDDLTLKGLGRSVPTAL
jgi:hypothetical protein